MMSPDPARDAHGALLAGNSRPASACSFVGAGRTFLSAWRPHAAGIERKATPELPFDPTGG
jgi:hypothetical protein